MDKVEFLVLRNLLYNEEYVRKVLPFIKGEYFEDYDQKVVFEEIAKFVGEYNEPPLKKFFVLKLRSVKILTTVLFRKLANLLVIWKMNLLNLIG